MCFRSCEEATADDLAVDCRMPWAAHYEQQSQQTAGAHTLGESILQVFLHTQHHRGQVCCGLREIGGVPPTIDFIVWLWSGRPCGALAGNDGHPVTLVTIACCAPQFRTGVSGKNSHPLERRH